MFNAQCQLERTIAINTLVMLLLPMLLALPAVAQQESAGCRSGAPPQGTLGITGMGCNCTVQTDAQGGARWLFDTEPRVLSLADDGPADGILEAGDMIVAIDGQLITTSAGGSRWSSLRPGESVRLRIRRGEGLRDVVVQTTAKCPGDAPASRQPVVADRVPEKSLLPRGWIGANLSCHCSASASGLSNDLLPGSVNWTFREPPVIGQVIEGGPAAAARLRAGDRLLTIDGVAFDTPEGGRRFSLMTPGTPVQLVIERDGRRLAVELVPALPPDASSRQ
jgi:S1-C subfamily serine protease